MADRPLAVPSLPFFRLALHEGRSQTHSRPLYSQSHQLCALSFTFCRSPDSTLRQILSQPMAGRPLAVPSCLSFGSLFTKADRKHTQPSPVQPITPPRRSQSHLPFPALASLGHSLYERWTGPHSERGRKEKNLSVHHHRMNNEQPPTPPDTHVTSIYRTTWLNMHLMGDLG